MSENPHDADFDEIKIFELLDILKNEWKIWVGTTVVGAVLATSVAFILPPKYEASAIVRVGQVGQVASVTTAIESLSDVVERMQSQAFRRSVAEQLLGKDANTGEIAQEMNRLKASPPKVMKGTNLVEINAAARTQGGALKTAEVLLESLKARHRPIYDQAVEQLKGRLAETSKNLMAFEKAYVAGAASNHAQEGAFIQLAQLTESGRYATLRSQQLAIENALLPLNTRPTDAIEPVSVSEQPVSPKKALISAIGVFAGAFLGGLLVFGRRAWRNYKGNAR